MKKFFKLATLTFMLFLMSASVFAETKKVSPIKPTASIPSGYYVLIPRCAPTRALSVKGNSTARYAQYVSRTYSKNTGQIFYISRNNDGTYTIKNKKSKLVLGIRGGSTKEGAIVRQGTDGKHNYQKWHIFKNGDYYMIQSSISKKMLTVAQSSTLNNAKIYMHTYHAHMKGERWKFVKLGGSVSSGSTTTSKYKTSSKTGMSSSDYKVLTNIIGAVETGGQVYGQRDYADYTAPYTNSSLEHTCTLGWGAFYGEEAQYLIKTIYSRNPAEFKKIDKKGLIQAALKKNWVQTRWKPSAAEKDILVKLITTETGKAVQDAMFTSLMKQYVSSCKSEYTDNTWAIMMYCQIRHLGGKNGADRIFSKCRAKNSYTLDTIMWALKLDQADTSSSNQVGDAKFWSRHEKCCEFIQKYA